MRIRSVRSTRRSWHRIRSPYWFLSFPKSGRTWSKHLLEAYFLHAFGIGPLDLVTWGPWRRTGDARAIPRTVFLHPPCSGPETGATFKLQSRLEGRKVVLMTRHPYDVVVSYFHRLRDRMQDPRVSGMDFSTFVRSPDLGIPRIIDFLNTWTQWLNGHDSSLLVRFEDTRTDPERQLRRLLKFLEVDVDQAALETAVAQTPDRTTRTHEDGSVVPSESDRRFIAGLIGTLHGDLAYQDLPEEAE